MNAKVKILTTYLIAGVLAAVLSGCGEDAPEDVHDDHSGHDHEQDAATHGADPMHESGGHADHDDHEGEDKHADEDGVRVKFSPAEKRAVGIKTARASGGIIRPALALPGEVRVNADRLAHISPRVEGIVRDVKKTLGDRVEVGEPIAVLESRELAEAKTSYLAESERLVLAKDIHTREERLWQQKISSEQEYLEAKQAFAEARIAKRTAEQRLFVFGLTDADLRSLPRESNDSFLRYVMVAPIAGTIVEKDIAVGETLESGSTPFTIADLSTVWVNLNVYPDDLASLGVGTEVAIRDGRGQAGTGSISYVSPMIDEATRTATARIVINNSLQKWRPGTFITAAAKADARKVSVLVPEDAVQTVDGDRVVFLVGGDAFKASPVTTGASDAGWIEVLSGLSPGDEFVVAGAFEIKAKIVTSSMDAHAGHGH